MHSIGTNKQHAISMTKYDTNKNLSRILVKNNIACIQFIVFKLNVIKFLLLQLPLTS